MINADTLLDRLYLKSQVTRWRLVALAVAVIALLVVFERRAPHSPIGMDYIARVTIDGFIGDNQQFYNLLDDVTTDKRAKAVILWIDTPGGSAVGGEEIYARLRKMAQSKPIVAVMRSMATSAGYMIALGADHIIAREGTITGSIGVLLEAAEVTELLQKLGVNPIVVKSAPLKGSPSMFEKVTPESQRVLQDAIDDFYGRFVTMVADRRQLPRDKVITLADGRIYGGKRALENRLIDNLGGEDQAVEWLETKKNIRKDLDIRDIEMRKEQDFLNEFTQSVIGKFWHKATTPLDGLVAVWHPALH